MGNPVTLPDPGDNIIFFDPTLQICVQVVVLKMAKKQALQWPGWKNVKNKNGKTFSINLDALSKNC